MRAKAYVQLREIESETDQRASEVCMALVGIDAGIHQHIVARLPIGLGGCVPVTVLSHSIAVWSKRTRAFAAAPSRSNAGVRDPRIVRVPCQVTAHMLAELAIDLAGLWQRLQHGRGGYG